MQKKYIVHIYVLGLKLLQWNFIYFYMSIVVVRTNFSADFWTFRIFDRNVAKIVAPPGNGNGQPLSASIRQRLPKNR